MVNRRARLGEQGFTVAELLVYLVVAVIVIAGIYQLLIGQNRLWTKQREMEDVRTSLRATASLLAYELRQVSAAGGDLYSIGASTVALRSVRGSGIVCAVHGSAPRFGLSTTTGDFDKTADDSALVFEAGGSGVEDDTWVIAKVKDTWLTGGGVDNCTWGTSSDITVEVDTAAYSGVEVGAPLRAFRRVEYALYSDGGRYWLGRKIGAAASYEKLTGPLSQPSDSGLVFVYYDQAGNVTANAAEVRFVDIILRGESYGMVPGQSGPRVQEDSLTLRVSLRG
jgi:hypothetical protein